jgi:hypothetical protein
MSTNVYALTLFPVKFDELCWTSFRRELLRSFAFLPLVAAYGAMAAAVMRYPLWQSVLYSAIPLVVMVCAQPIIDCLKLSFCTNDTRRVSMWLLWVGGGTAYFFAGCIVIFVPSAAWRLGAVGCCGLISGSVVLWYRAAYHRGVFDVILKPYSE